VLDRLLALHEEWAIDLQDAVAVYRADDGRLRVDRSVHPTRREGAATGAIFGALLGALLAAPFTAGASAAAAAAAFGIGGVTLGAAGGAAVGREEAATYKETFGITDEFVQQVGGVVQPGQSAVFVLARAADPEGVAGQFRGLGGTVLRTTLAPEQVQSLQATLAAPREPAAR
jgi:uncharacterized membrane protein